MNKHSTLPEIIKYHSDILRCHTCGTDAEKIAHVIAQYHDAATSTLITVKAFRDDLLVYLRAMSLMVDTASNAVTHQEKNARLRGMSELLESSIERIRNARLEFTLGWHPNAFDVFRSDYPTRHFVERIHELEDELKVLKGETNVSPNLTEHENKKRED